MKSLSITVPPALQPVGDGSYFYNFNIEEIEVPPPGGAGEPTVQYQCDQVRVYKSLTKNNILEAVIAAKWPDSVEKKLINDYNAVQLEVINDDGHIDAYKAFLEERAALKDEIDGLEIP